tara:strand:- start:2340 stop:3356 length:1017 start_codon:yes stop_codon:yes gene_type:complete
MNFKKNLAPPEVVCLGEALLDRLGPIGGAPSQSKDVVDCLGGAPANVACGLARLDVNVAFVGRFGQDLVARKFLDLMSQRNINLNAVQIDEIRPTRIVLVSRDLNGERSFNGFSGDLGKGFSDQALSIVELKNKFQDLFSHSKYLLIGTIPLASKYSSESILWSIDESLRNNVDIAIDINWRSKFWNIKRDSDSGPDASDLKIISPVLQKASLIKVSKEEAIWFFNSYSPKFISKSLPQNPDVVVTNGSRKIEWFLKGFEGNTIPIKGGNIIDTTGAGDAFMAGLLYGLIHNSSSYSNDIVKHIVEFAAACGAIVCEKSGAIDPQPNVLDVQRFLLKK